MILTNTPAADHFIGLVTVNYYSQTEIAGLFDHLSGGRLELVVVSNSPEADSLSAEHSCQFVRAPSNIGFASACNLGASALTTEYLVFCNPDVRIGASDLRAICQRLKENPEYGLLSPHFRIQPPSTAPIQPHDGRIIGFCIVMPRRVLAEIGGWDPHFFLWGEDGDLCERVRQAGYKTGYANGIVADHSSQHSIRSLSLSERQFLTRVWICSQIYSRLKHKGACSAMTYCLSQTLVNFGRGLFGKTSFGRDYQDPRAASRFGWRVLGNAWRLARYVQFDGKRFLWGDPNRELRPQVSASVDPIAEGQQDEQPLPIVPIR